MNRDATPNGSARPRARAWGRHPDAKVAQRFAAKYARARAQDLGAAWKIEMYAPARAKPCLLTDRKQASGRRPTHHATVAACRVTSTAGYQHG